MTCPHCNAIGAHVTRRHDGDVERGACPVLMDLIRLARKTARRGVPAEMRAHTVRREEDAR